jgi:flagellar protein FliT
MDIHQAANDRCRVTLTWNPAMAALHSSPHALATDADGIPAIYQQLADISDRMLECAQRGDWDAVSGLEVQCGILVESLKATAPEDCPTEHRDVCMQSIRIVLANDAAIRDLAQPWLKELEDILRVRRTRPMAHTFR